jgi:AraC-like DNA-binding protein
MESLNTNYPCHINPELSNEQFIPDHIFIYFKAGSVIINDRVTTYHIKAGEFCIAKRNHLAKYMKSPDQFGKLDAISIVFKKDFLKSFVKEYNLINDQPPANDDAIIKLATNNLLLNFVSSLTPYLGVDDTSCQDFLSLKNKEIILILLKTYPDLKNILFDFNDPSKIDLEDFMNNNFHFNVSLERFAYLSGRSLTSFKQDFNRIFRTSPGRWLLNKRLQEAHHLIKNKKRKPSEIYLEIGFEDLSHFSFAFKKLFGIAPSHLI